LVLTTTISVTVPDITDPDCETEPTTTTAMKDGTVTGGPELFPGSEDHVDPQVAGVVLRVSAKPLKLFGAGAPLNELLSAHWAPQKFADAPRVALLSPMTKAPLASVW